MGWSFRLLVPDRVLAFASDAARLFAVIIAGRRSAGRRISFADAQIATTALSHGASLATRNVADFALCGIDVIDLSTPR